MISRLRPLLFPAFLTLLMGAILIGLGVWQLHRLSWKEAIITKIDARTKAPPQKLPPRSDWAGLNPADYEYRRVTLSGTFENGDEIPVFRGSADGAGYLIMTPLRLRDGGTVIVNRGWVPLDLKNRAKHQAGDIRGPVTITGLMREPEARNAFTPADDPAKAVFFTRDPSEIAHQLGLTDAAPFTVDADATPNPGGWPRGGATVLVIPNNHFSYAMRWFGLALALLGVSLSFAWKRVVQDKQPDNHHVSAGSPG